LEEIGGLSSIGCLDQVPTIKTQPDHGTLSAGIGHLVYTANADYTGTSDVFTISVDCKGVTYELPVKVFINYGSSQATQVLASTSYTFDLSEVAGIDANCANVVPSILSNPSQGTLTVSRGKIKYTNTNIADYRGTDNFAFAYFCGGQPYIVPVKINIIPKPDNIDEADCWITPPVQQWTMGETRTNETNLSTYAIPLVGNIDNNLSTMEIIIAVTDANGLNGDRPGNNENRYTQHIAIYNGKNIKQTPKIITTTERFCWAANNAYAIVNTTIAGVKMPIIVVAEEDCKLRAYDHNGNVKWISSEVYTTTSDNRDGAPGFYDFNKDGIPEIISNARIFDSGTGAFLGEAAGAGTFTDIPIAADLYGTGNLNLILDRSYNPA
jgi:hypothetical protein